MIILLINSITAIMWLGVLLNLDSSSGQKGNRNLYYIFFIAGALSTLPAIILYQIFPWYDYSWKQESWKVFVNYVLITGPVEELSKFFLFFIIVLKMKTIREPRDGMLQAASAGLGFAIVENFMYANEYGASVLLVRSFLCIAGHMICACIWGIFTGRVIFENKRFLKRFHYPYIVFSLTISALIHGLYDYFLNDYTLILGPIMAITIDYLAIFAAYKIYLKTGTNSPYKLYPLREFNKAINILNMALCHDPDNHMLNKRIALYYLYAGDYKSAIEHFGTCIRLKPENFYCHAFSGVSFILAGEKENGMNIISESLGKLSPTSINTLKKNIRAVIDDSRIKDEILYMIDYETDQSSLSQHWHKKIY